MSDDSWKLVAQTATNLVVVGVVAAAWLTGKATSEAALLAILSVSGVQFAGSRVKNAPPAGPTGLALFMAAESIQHLLG